MKIFSHILITLSIAACLLGAFDAAAQLTDSPYSRFGYGILSDNATSAQRQMGGVGYAMNSGRQVNVMNPASYAMVDSMTFLFDMGLDFVANKRTENDAHHSSFSGGLEYITMLFPITKYMGASFGLLPYSSVGYSFGSDIDNGSELHSGEGGLNQIYLGVGATPFKGLMIGANVSYLFGNTYNDVYVSTNGGSTSLFEQQLQVRDYHLLFGAQYSWQISRSNRVTLGLSFSPGKALLGNADVLKYDITANESPDTVAHVSMKNYFSLPDTWGAGVNYEWNSKLMVEADFTFQPWSKATFKDVPHFTSTRYNDRYKVALGAQYTPNWRGNFFQRTQYRCGAFFNRDYMRVGDNSVREWGVSCGFGLPNPNNKSVVSVGFEYRKRQAHPNPLLKEDYFTVTLGINFNELWFFKNKIY